MDLPGSIHSPERDKQLHRWHEIHAQAQPRINDLAQERWRCSCGKNIAWPRMNRPCLQQRGVRLTEQYDKGFHCSLTGRKMSPAYATGR